MSQPEICVFDHNPEPERTPLLQPSTNSDGDTTSDSGNTTSDSGSTTSDSGNTTSDSGNTTSGDEMPYHVYSWYVNKIINKSTS